MAQMTVGSAAGPTLTAVKMSTVTGRCERTYLELRRVPPNTIHTGSSDDVHRLKPSNSSPAV